MRKFLAILAVSTVMSTQVLAECVLKQITNTEQSGTIKSVKDIQRFVTAWTDSQRKCNVEFNALIDNSWHKGYGAYAFGNGESENRACAVALNEGKRNLLQELFPQSVQSEDVLICSDEKPRVRKTGLEGLSLNTDKPEFYHRGAMCRWYLQTVKEEYGLYQWNIVACNLQPNQWTIVDKF